MNTGSAATPAVPESLLNEARLAVREELETYALYLNASDDGDVYGELRTHAAAWKMVVHGLPEAIQQLLSGSSVAYVTATAEVEVTGWISGSHAEKELETAKFTERDVVLHKVSVSFSYGGRITFCAHATTAIALGVENLEFHKGQSLRFSGSPLLPSGLIAIMSALEMSALQSQRQR
jgi:hypothetical protein